MTDKCKTHPDAPHGFDRNGSHSADRYVCECEGWEPIAPDALARAAYLAGWLDGMAGDPDECGNPAWVKRRDEALERITKGGDF